MAATRQNPPFQIYQDVVPPQPMPHNTNKPRPHLQPSAMPLQPIGNPQQPYQDIMIHPPMHMQQPHISPLKSQPISPEMQHYATMSYIHIPAPMQGAPYAGSPMKRGTMPPAQHYRPAPMPHAMFATFDSNLDFTQDNYQMASAVQDTYVDFPDHAYSRRQTLKRSYSDAAPATDKSSSKRLCLEDLPDPEDMAPVEDDGNKPQYSYAQMIGMAILRAPNRQLTLAQIYDWISSTFAFYRDDPKQGWHNSIRHNLSLNKAFTKRERPKGDAGKGSYWIIEPGLEMQFLKDKPRKHINVPGMTVHQNGMRSDIQVMAPPLAEALAPKPWSVRPTLPPRPQTAPALPELSSDATLPASDPALEEEESADAKLPTTTAQPISPAPTINSSPPVPVSNHTRTISSPARIRPNLSKQHRRSVTVMEDSGYWSELPSSHRKPNMNNGIVLTSELDIVASSRKQLARVPGGRAEDEIRRMRSSPRVPTPDHKAFDGLIYFEGSSSPVRPSPFLAIEPATPAVTFKKPLKPPASVSPNSQLLFHRKAMTDFTASPVKRPGLEFGATTPLLKTPGVNLRSQFEEEFEMWQENNLHGKTPATPGLNSSPLKKSVKRPGTLLRMNTTAGILSDATNMHRLNAKTPSRTPLLKSTMRGMPAGSPLKNSTLPPFDAYDDFINFGDENLNLAFDENSDGEGLDLSQGFGKIGAIMTTPGRPSLGQRSYTTTF